MKKFISRLIRVILIVTIPFIILTSIDFLTEITGGKLGDYLEENYGINKKPLFIFLISLLVVSLVFEIYQKWKEEKEKPELTNPNELETDVKKFYDSLKERYQKRYDSKLDGRFEITLEVNEDWNIDKPKTYKFDAEAKISPAFEAVRKAFDNKGRLLIVGSPGSGKTVLLLKLALELLGEECQKEQKLPVIFNLASWSDKYKNFEDWLIDVLNSGNGLSKNFAKTLLQENRIIFLLDGLDELARHLDNQKDSTEEAKIEASKIRADCLKAIYQYTLVRHQLVICSRLEQFKAIQTTSPQDAPVSAKVEVLELTESEILLALQHAESDAQSDDEGRLAARHLLQIIEKADDNSLKVLLEVLSTPFYFTTALEVIGKSPLNENDFSKDAEGIRNHLLEKFVNGKVHYSPKLIAFEKDNAKVKKWLKWLAKLMEKKQLVTFELATLQPTDLENKFTYSIIYNIFATLFFFIYFQLNPFIYTNFILVMTLICLVVNPIGYTYIHYSKRINTEDKGKFAISALTSWRTYTNSIFDGILYPTLFLCLILFVLFLMDRNLPLTYKTLISFLLFYLFLILNFFVLSLIGHCRLIIKYLVIEKPYRRLLAGFIFKLLNGLAVSVLFFLSLMFLDFLNIGSANFKNNLDFLFNLMGIGIIIGILITPILKHIVLRISLYLERATPLKYATFLDYAAEARILEKDGGQWRFRHQNLQDYFAKLGK